MAKTFFFFFFQFIDTPSIFYGSIYRSIVSTKSKQIPIVWKGPLSLSRRGTFSVRSITLENKLANGDTFNGKYRRTAFAHRDIHGRTRTRSVRIFYVLRYSKLTSCVSVARRIYIVPKRTYRLRTFIVSASRSGKRASPACSFKTFATTLLTEANARRK